MLRDVDTFQKNFKKNSKCQIKDTIPKMKVLIMTVIKRLK